MQKITLTSSTRECIVKSTFLGYEGENEVNKLVFEFTDGFKDGLGVLNIQRGDEYGYVSLDKVETTYEFPVRNSILSKIGDIRFQVVITGNDGSIIKYDPFTMTVKDAIDSESEMPEEYPSWVDMANAKLAEVDQAITNAEIATRQAEDVANNILEAKANGEFNGKDGEDGKDGVEGEDGVSPTVTTEQTETGAKISITDVDGIHVAEVFNGRDGRDGADGKDGTMSFEELTEEQKASLKGDKGDAGEQGSAGADGKDGEDGFSPIATVTQTETGATISITDVNGTTTAEITNGKDGEGGAGGGVGQAGTGTNAEIFNDYTNNVASADYAHAEGYKTDAIGNSSHAEGANTTANGTGAHAEGSYTIAKGNASHAEGASSKTDGVGAHAEGYSNANANYAHSEGNTTTAQSLSQHVQGEYNIIDASGAKNERGKYAHIVGNGTSSSNRSNSHTLDWDGVGWFKSKVKIGGTSQDDANAKELATIEYVDNAVANVGGGNVGGGNVSQTVLWEGTLSTSNQTVNLSDSVENYDYIGVAWKYSSSSYVRIMPIAWLDVQSIKDGQYAGNVMFPTTAFVNVRDSMSRQVTYSFPSATQFKYNDAMAPTSDSSVTKSLTRVIGIKLDTNTGGANGGSSYSETELLSTPAEYSLKTSATVFNQELSLGDAITNYDALVFEFDIYAGGYYGLNNKTLLVSGITYNASSDYTAVTDGSQFDLTTSWNGGTVTSSSLLCYFKNPNTLAISYTATNKSNYTKFRIRSIKGIKY